jgi:SAM-dependent methyltransferase
MLATLRGGARLAVVHPATENAPVLRSAPSAPARRPAHTASTADGRREAEQSAAPVATWDDIAASRRLRGEPGAWRLVSDAVNVDLVAGWLPASADARVLKTDLYDEVAGLGLVPDLLTRFGSVTGVDVSPVAVEAACGRHPQLEAVVADVRRLPFSDRSFDAVVSNSTLDHLRSLDDVVAALAEIRRVLRAGGLLVLTFDNGANPVVALRDALPARLRLPPLVPFPVGVTCGPARLRSLLEEGGFRVTAERSILHCPRALAVLGAHLVDRHGNERARRRYVRLLTAFELLGLLPTRYVTGYFAAALAVRA